MKRITGSIGMLLVALFNFQTSSLQAQPPDSQPGASATTAGSVTTSPSTASVDATAPTTVGHEPISFFDKKFPVTFGLSVGETYDDNIFIQPQKTSDWVTDISPSLLLELGQKINLDHNIALEDPQANPENLSNENYFSLSYKPTVLLYADNSNLDSINQAVDALYAHQFSKLTLALEQRYAYLTEPTIQTSLNGGNVNRDIFTTIARANYVYSDKLSTYGTFTQTINDYHTAGFTNTNEWIGDYYFLYQATGKISIGVGPRIGFVDVTGAPNQTWQAGLVHLFYVPTGKLSFTMDVGGEVREYQGNGSGDRATPVLDASGTYRPFDSTSITLSAGRDVHASNSFIGQDYTASRVQLGLRQRFVQVLYFNLNAGYENDNYSFASQGLTGPTREDNYYYIKPGFDWVANDWLTVSAYYQYSKDNSNFHTVSFNDNQVNITASVKY